MQYVDRKHLLQIPSLWAEGATDTVSEASMAEIALSTVSFFNVSETLPQTQRVVLVPRIALHDYPVDADVFPEIISKRPPSVSP